MLRRTILLPLLIALSAGLVVNDFADAQRRSRSSAGRSQGSSRSSASSGRSSSRPSVSSGSRSRSSSRSTYRAPTTSRPSSTTSSGSRSSSSAFGSSGSSSRSSSRRISSYGGGSNSSGRTVSGNTARYSGGSVSSATSRYTSPSPASTTSRYSGSSVSNSTARYRTTATRSSAPSTVTVSDLLKANMPSATARTRSASTSVPKLHGAREPYAQSVRVKTPSSDRRLALKNRLRAATAQSKAKSLKTSTLAERYSRGVRNQTGQGSKGSIVLHKASSKPGAARRKALAAYKTANKTAVDTKTNWKDYGTGSGTGTNGASGSNAHRGDDPWSGYYDDNYHGGNFYNCFWNNYYPSWCIWWLTGCGSWWYPSYGWSLSFGTGYGLGLSYNSPYYGSPYYGYPYTNYGWPVYENTTINNYYSGPAESAPIAAAPAAPLVGHASRAVAGERAAVEYMALGDRAFIEGRYGDAAHYYAKATTYDPGDGLLYLVLSDALFATGDYHYAADALREALNKLPELASLGLDKRDFYGNPADFESQLQLLEAYQRDHELDEDAQLLLSANYLFSGRAQGALGVLESPFSEESASSEARLLIRAAALGILAGS